MRNGRTRLACSSPIKFAAELLTNDYVELCCAVNHASVRAVCLLASGSQPWTDGVSK